jgi:hypothetical protein
MATTKYMSGSVIRKHMDKQVGKITVEMLQLKGKDVDNEIEFRAFSPEQIEHHVVYYRATKTCEFVHEKTFLDDYSLSELVKLINRFWQDKNWICTLTLGYYYGHTSTPSIGGTVAKYSITVTYRNTKYKIANPYAFGSTNKFRITKTKPSIRASRNTAQSKDKIVNSLNGKKVSPKKRNISKLVGIHPTRK